MLVTTLWSAGGLTMFLWAPLTSPSLVLLATAAPLAWFYATGPSFSLQRPSPLLVVFALAGAYLVVNASWSLSQSMAYMALGMFFACLAAFYIMANTLPGVETDALRAIALGLVLGTVVGAAVLCFDTFAHQLTKRVVMSLLPPLRPKPRDMEMAGGWVTLLQPYLLNRSITALSFAFWPALLAIMVAVPDARARRWWTIGLVPGVAAILAAEHATSKFALAGATVVFGLFHVWPTLVRRMLILGWVVAILFVVPLAMLAYQNHLYLSTWLPPSARHRIVIWGYTSQLYGNAPIFGAGISTARALNDNAHDASLAPGSDFRLTTGLHSHNGYLQTWYEAGAVGALFLLVLGLMVLRALARAPLWIQPYLFATFATCALLGASSFSLWQPWFMAAFGFAALCTMVGWALAERSLGAGVVRASDGARALAAGQTFP